MDISVEQESDAWINQAFGVRSVPEICREHYPFSRCTALSYRLKLVVVLLNAICALFRVDEPCLRLSLLLNYWLLWVACAGLYKNYPWREPLNIWMWRIRWAVPCSEWISTICAMLLMVAWAQLESWCELPNPLTAASVSWLCCMMAWPLTRERWRRKERSEDDYDQFSVTRPLLLTLPEPLGQVLATLRSPSLLALLAASITSWAASLVLPGWVAHVWAASTGILSLGCLAILCCHSLPEDVGRTLASWEMDESSYARKIENSLRMVKCHLRTSGLPQEGSIRFDRLAVQVPLLQREADLLVTASRTLTENRAQELEKLATSSELMEFGQMLHRYGPYTTECCIF